MSPIASVIYATRAGGKTLDQDKCGGNPFATALLGAFAHSPSSLKMVLDRASSATVAATNGLQNPVWKLQPGHSRWDIQETHLRSPQTRHALVLVVADYDSVELGVLVGAAHDERRIASALALYGFSVIQGVGRGKSSVVAALQTFAKQSAKGDAGLIYCTGHGVHTRQGTALLPSDYPHRRGYSTDTLLRYALPVSELAASCQAAATNLVFFAGCRTRAPEA